MTSPLYEQAEEYRAAGDWQRAASLYEPAIAELPPDFGAGDRAALHNNWGECLWQLRRQDDALARFRAACAIARDAAGTPFELSLLSNLAHAAENIEPPDLRLAAAAYRRIAERQAGDPREQFVPLVQCHDALSRAGRNHEALTMAKALVALEKRVPEAGKSIAALQRLSVGWRRLGKLRRAAAAYDALWRRIENRGDLPAQTCYTIAFDHADVLHDAGRLRDAARASEEALALIGTLSPETSREYGLAQSRWAQRLYALGEYERSVALFERTLANCTMLKPRDRVSMQSNLAKAQTDAGAYILARETLAVTEALLDEHDLWSSVAAVGVCDATAQWCRTHKDFKAAIAYCRRSLKIAKGLSRDSDRKQANTLNLLGGLLRADGHGEEALEAYQAALSLSGPVETLRINTLHNLAACFDGLGREEEAEKYYRRALKEKEQFYGTRHPSVASTLHNLGLIHARRNDADIARNMFDRALSIETDVFGANYTNTLRTRFSRALFLHGIGEQADAVAEFEAIALAEERVLAELTVSPEAPARRRILLDGLDVLDAYLEAIAPAMEGDAVLSAAAYRHVRFRKGLASAADQITGAPAAQVMEKLALNADPARALSSEEMLIDFVIWPDREGLAQVGIFIVEPDDRVRFFRIGKVGNIRDDVAAFLEAMQGNDIAALKQIGARLYAMLLPVPARHAAHLVFCPDGPLCALPFAALWTDDNWLGLDKMITYVAAARDLLRVPTPPRTPPVVFAAPAFGLSKAGRFTFLNGALQEGKAVADILGTKLHTGRAVTAEALSALQGPELLHIATHAALLPDENGSHRAVLALADANNNTRDGGGLISTNHIAKLNLCGTKLATLSACRSMIGESHRFDNMDGLRRAVQTAGAACVLSSVIPVGDSGTATFMAAFYTALHAVPRDPPSIAEALQKAQKQMQAECKPFRDWAPWSLYR